RRCPRPSSPRGPDLDRSVAKRPGLLRGEGSLEQPGALASLGAGGLALEVGIQCLLHDLGEPLVPPAGCQLEQARAVLPLDLDRGAHAWIIHARACRWQQAWIHDCQAQEIQFTRGRPYQKDDNVHIEQKNWTHVRKLLGYVRDDTTVAQAAIHALYDRGRHRP